MPHSEQYALNALQQIKLVLKRQVLLFVRDPVMVRARMMQCLVMGLLIGGLWFQLGTELDDTRYALLLVVCFGCVFPRAPLHCPTSCVHCRSLLSQHAFGLFLASL